MRKLLLSITLLLLSFSSVGIPITDFEYTVFEFNTSPVPDDLVDTEEDVFIPDVPEKKDLGQIAIDYYNLKEINPETVGWINIPNVCYLPIMYSGDQKYLHLDVYGNYLYSGTLFMGSNSNGSFENMALIYGHHMKDGTMFAGLKQYKNEAFFNNNGLIEVFDGSYLYRYKVYTIFNIVDGEEFINQDPHEEKVDYFKSLYERSFVKGGEPDDYNTQMLFFQTCDYLGYDNCRLVVGSYLIEKVSVD